MRCITKTLCPGLLAANHDAWLAQVYAEPNNQAAKVRYRERDIKNAILDETSGKCIYCESKVGHNTPGDVEHLLPVRHYPHLRFRWENLSLACTECNRRKGDYNNAVHPFLNPYIDEVEDRLIHHGPYVGSPPGDRSSEITVRTLQLNDPPRQALIMRKIEKIHELYNVLQRYSAEPNGPLKELIYAELLALAYPRSEFSGMVHAILRREGFIP